LVFLGREISEQRNYSETIAYEIDMEVRRLVDEATERAEAILVEQFDKLEALANLLIREETIEHEQFESVFDAPRPKPSLAGPPWGRPAYPKAGRPGPPVAEDRPEPDPGPVQGHLRPQPAN
jgi:cell division protease FtsH